MNLFPFFPAAAFRLRPKDPAGDEAVAFVTVSGEKSQSVVLPYADGLGYFVAPATRTPLSIRTEDFRIERLGLLASQWVRLRLKLLFKKKKYLSFSEFSLFSSGAKHDRKRFTTFNQHMISAGSALDGDLVARRPELLNGWGDDAAPRAVAQKQPRGESATAIVAHVYYEDTWPDIAGVLKRLAIPFDLIVTTVPGRETLARAVSSTFPFAEIRVTENRGRDVRPFLALLEEGRLDRYRYVCKIHGKKSSDAGRMPYMGALWRRRLLFDLLGAPGVANQILDRFGREPKVGMVGSRVFRLPNCHYPEALSWAANRDATLELAGEMGIAPESFRLDFFGGTMFWVRPEALNPLRRLHLAEAFSEEIGRIDGRLEHSVERLFSAAVIAAGYELADVEGT
jgi:hypothetical protein